MEEKKLTSDFAWRIYNFIQEWKAGEFGEIPLQEALDRFFRNLCERRIVMEAYCSYEVAKLLVKKGFNSDLVKGALITHQLACDWVRKKGWHISVQLTYDENYNAVYYVTISSTKTFIAEDIGELEYKYFSNVEDATEAALKYSLENLI